MSTRAEPLRVMLEAGLPDETTHASPPALSGGWTPERFAAEQIRGLVQQIFLSRGSACRQVAFSPVDSETDVRELCLQVARTLAEHLRKVCVVDRRAEAIHGGMARESNFHRGVSGTLGESPHQISEHLWRVSGEAVLGSYGEPCSAEVLSRRLDELRSEFDGRVIEAPAAGSSTAGLLGRLSDGLVLVLEANSTRRLAAQRAQTTLHAAEVKLLGIVLSERTFPIPERLYRKL